MKRAYLLTTAAACLLTTAAPAYAQQPVGTAFTFQGQLKDGGQPANGLANLRFELWNAPTGGTQFGAADPGPTTVVNGLFTAVLDFGAGPFATNEARWLQVIVNGTPLSPRQALTATPFSLATRGIQVDAEGNVSVGADSPDGARLDLFTGPGTGWINFGSDMNFDGGGDGVFYFRHTGPPDGRTSFVTNNDEHLTIRNDGRVGVNISDPSGPLDVRGNTPGQVIYADNSFDGTGYSHGVWGVARSTQGIGVRGNGSTGVYGAASATSGRTYGVFGEASSPDGFGGYFQGRGYFSDSVGIGTIAPHARLDVQDPSAAGRHGLSVSANCDTGFATLRVHSDHNPDPARTLISVSQQSNMRLVVRMDGSVGIGTTTPSQLLSVNGSAGKPGGGSWATFCDARLKQNVQPLEGALDRLLQLHGYEFEYTAGALADGRGLPGRQVGLIAQEVQPVFPDWVEADASGYLFVTERATTALMVESLRELRAEKDAAIADLRAANQEQVSALKARLAEVQAGSDALRTRLGRIEKLLGADALTR